MNKDFFYAEDSQRKSEVHEWVNKTWNKYNKYSGKKEEHHIKLKRNRKKDVKFFIRKINGMQHM